MRDLAQAQQNKHFPTYNSSCSANALCCCRQQDDLPIQPPHGVHLCRHGMAQKFNKNMSQRHPQESDASTFPKLDMIQGVPLSSQLQCDPQLSRVLRGRAAPTFFFFVICKDLKKSKGIWAQKLSFIITEIGFYFFLNRQKKYLRVRGEWSCQSCLLFPVFREHWACLGQ